MMKRFKNFGLIEQTPKAIASLIIIAASLIRAFLKHLRVILFKSKTFNKLSTQRYPQSAIHAAL